mmetsp:Transcript_18344/g.52503  ORF Transcript_18344/g.52503 Transcript_18344/m.52503 type:complete len:404 (+) Transcript_18344:70-1281(+)
MASAATIVGRRFLCRSRPSFVDRTSQFPTPCNNTFIANQVQRREVSTLILIRHGQSLWNGPSARFTGWCDIPLTVRGRVEAVAAGQLMRSRGIKASSVCVAFSSELQRAHETCELALASMAGHEQETWSSERIRRDWRLNERHYGAVQGLFKNDSTLAEKHGADKVMEWRRSLHGRPPPMEQDHEYYLPPPAPLTESLADCQTRVMGCFEDTIAPALFDEEGLPVPPDDRTIIVVAHANTIRSLIAYFDEVPEDQVSQIYVPNSVPILYRFERTTRKPVSTKLQSSHGGSHARWMISSENHQIVRDAVSTGGMLTRALFDAMDVTQDRALCRAEIEAGVRELMKDSEHETQSDCVVIGLAKKLARELGEDETITLQEFERRTALAYEGLQCNESDFANEEPFP